MGSGTILSVTLNCKEVEGKVEELMKGQYKETTLVELKAMIRRECNLSEDPPRVNTKKRAIEFLVKNNKVDASISPLILIEHQEQEPNSGKYHGNTIFKLCRR